MADKQRKCLNCDKPIVRKIFPSGGKESSIIFKNRKFCDNACRQEYLDAEAERNFVYKDCPECGKRIERQRKDNGRLETQFVYDRRVSCVDPHCMKMRRHYSKSRPKLVEVKLSPIDVWIGRKMV